MHSTIAIEIAAPPALVFALARDVERWDRLLPHYARSRAVARGAGWRRSCVDFVARRPLVAVLGLGLPVTWRARTLERAGRPAACASSTWPARRRGWT